MKTTKSSARLKTDLMRRLKRSFQRNKTKMNSMVMGLTTIKMLLLMTKKTMLTKTKRTMTLKMRPETSLPKAA